MGLCITGNYKNSISLDGGYGMLKTIREEVAKAWDKEFGKHYATLKYCNDYEEFDKRANQILKNERFKKEDKDILDFLYACYCDGQISYKTCKKIYELIKDTNCKYCLRYVAYSNNDWEDFKQLLKECYSHRSNLVWY